MKGFALGLAFKQRRNATSRITQTSDYTINKPFTRVCFVRFT